MVRWLEFEFDALDFTDVILLFLGESLPLLAQQIVKYGAQYMQKKEDHGHSFVRNLNLPTLNIIADVLWTSSIDLAANAESGTENLLNTTLELL